MAQYTYKGSDLTGWPTTFEPNKRVPIIGSRIFKTLADLNTYLNDSTSSAIAGIQVGVIDDTTATNNGVYSIEFIDTTQTETVGEKTYIKCWIEASGETAAHTNLKAVKLDGMTKSAGDGIEFTDSGNTRTISFKNGNGLEFSEDGKAQIKVSSATGNIIQVSENGIYATAGSSVTISEVVSVDLTSRSVDSYWGVVNSHLTELERRGTGTTEDPYTYWYYDSQSVSHQYAGTVSTKEGGHRYLVIITSDNEQHWAVNDSSDVHVNSFSVTGDTVANQQLKITLNDRTESPTTYTVAVSDLAIKNQTVVGETEVTGGTTNYVSVSVSETTANQFDLESKVKIQSMSTAASTAMGLAEASDVKSYVDNFDCGTFSINNNEDE